MRATLQRLNVVFHRGDLGYGDEFPGTSSGAFEQAILRSAEKQRLGA
jgi:hypothetical protein